MKKYHFYSTLLLLPYFFFAQYYSEVKIIYMGILTIIATLLNHYMLMAICSAFVAPHCLKKKKLFFLFFLGMLKFALVGGALIWGVHYLGNKILIPIIGYVIHIFLLSTVRVPWKFGHFSGSFVGVGKRK